MMSEQYIEIMKVGKDSWNRYRKSVLYVGIEIEYVSFENDDLTDFNFRGVNFSHCSFKGATLQGTRFDGCKFYLCDFRDAKFWKTNFQDADLRYCAGNSFPVDCLMDGAILTPRQIGLARAVLEKICVKERD